MTAAWPASGLVCQRAAPDRTLPLGFAVRLPPRTRRYDGGRTLVGGNASSVLFLSPRAAAMTARPTLVVEDESSAALARVLLDRGYADPCWPPSQLGVDRVADVTVVVPVRDRAAALSHLLAALPEGLPVVVVDDASTSPDAVADLARAHGARLLRHEHNRGPAAARNTGLRAVATPLVAFCDSDVVPEPGWLATLRAHLADPALGVVAPRVLGPASRPDDGWLDRYEQARSSLDLGPRAAAVRPGSAVSYLPSACLLGRVEAFGDGFDEDLRVGEDVDLVWRLIERGWGVRYEPAAAVRHQHRTRPREWLVRKAAYGTSAAPLAARHGDAVAPLVLTPWTAVLSVALLVQRRWSLPVAAAACAVTTTVLAGRLGSSPSPRVLATRLTVGGAQAAVWQTGSALTRHHWPLALAAALASRRARRALLLAAVLDGVADHRRVRPDLGVAPYVGLRRADDLAYGAGLWWGVLRARSVRALLPAGRRWGS